MVVKGYQRNGEYESCFSSFTSCKDAPRFGYVLEQIFILEPWEVLDSALALLVIVLSDLWSEVEGLMFSGTPQWSTLSASSKY